MEMGQVLTVVRKTTSLEAVRWWKAGDHPGDGIGQPRFDPLSQTMFDAIEGAVVRFYRDPLMHPGEVVHGKCGWRYADHGFIDHYDGGQRVCPGDWVLADSNGYHYPVSDEHFHKEYNVISS